MAGAADKARFYLEQSVPELRELERKELFSRVSSSRSFIRIALTVYRMKLAQSRRSGVNSSTF